MPYTSDGSYIEPEVAMENWYKKHKRKVNWLIVSLLLLLVITSGLKVIQAGSVGVVKRFGKVTGGTLEPGMHLIAPFVDTLTTLPTKKVTYETAIEGKQKDSKADYKDYPVDTNTQDGQPVDISYTVRFSVDPTQAGWAVQNIGTENDLVEKIVKTESRVWARNVPRGFTAEQLYSGEGVVKVQQNIFDAIAPTFQKNGLVLDFFGVREITFDPTYVQAIKLKQEAEVQIQTEKNKAEQEVYRKQQRITAAEASAQEQELQRTTLSPQLLQKMYYEKWNGVLPQIMLGNDTTSLIQLPNLK